MLINRLLVLLAERGEKASSVSHKTGIARSTLSALSNNSSRMIQFDTINTLCRYLQVTPGDFFEYYPNDFEFSLSFAHKKDEQDKERNSNEQDLTSVKNIQGKLICYTSQGVNDIELTGAISKFEKGNGKFHVLIRLSLANDWDKFQFKLNTEEMSYTLKQELYRRCERAIEDQLFSKLDNPLEFHGVNETLEYKLEF